MSYRAHVMGALFPLVAGIVLYGWRAAAVSLVVMGATALGVYVWGHVGMRGAIIRYPRALWLALLLSLMLPPHLILGTARPPFEMDLMIWAILPAAGLLLAILLWLIGGMRWAPIHPLLLVYLVLVFCYHESLTPHVVLHRARLAVGDVMDIDPLASPSGSNPEPWICLTEKPRQDALYLETPAAQRLADYTRGLPRQRAPMAMEAMLRDYMPPLEDVAFGGHPGPIGASSAIALLVGGLVLLYFGAIDYRVPLIILSIAFAGFSLLPTLVMQGAQADWEGSVTFANYEIMASPLLLMAIFLATHREICPANRKARGIFALLVGLLTVGSQLYLSVAYGPYIALGIGALLTPWLEQRYELPNPT
ncbi:MAG TPA: RnfABCDGE type electron transport complex subunit D [Tepidisphaeraceae bacterium]|nr:RnfABCDGE type electron transport complex subunit D [Tepidisphaeraceae bacterium]